MTAAAAYLLTVVPELNHQEALQVVRGTRAVANPNIGFQKQLAEFESGGGLDKVGREKISEADNKASKSAEKKEGGGKE